MNDWQSKQQLTMAIRFLISKRMQTIPKKDFADCFFSPRKSCAEIQGDREIELWVTEVKELRGKCGFLSFP